MPLPQPGQLVCLAGNYIEPDSPSRGEFNAFLKSPTSVISTKETVRLPEVDVTVFHFEPELAIVIGKTAKHLSEENALDYHSPVSRHRSFSSVSMSSIRLYTVH